MKIEDIKYDQKEIDAYLSQESNAIKTAMMFDQLLREQGITQKQLAKQLNITQGTVANKLRLLRLPDYVKQAVLDNRLSERHARALLKVEEKDLTKVYERIVSKNYTVKESEEYIYKLYNKSTNINKGISRNIEIGINTIRQAYEMCKKAGLEASLEETDYDKEIKLVVRFKK